MGQWHTAPVWIHDLFSYVLIHTRLLGCETIVSCTCTKQCQKLGAKWYKTRVALYRKEHRLVTITAIGFNCWATVGGPQWLLGYCSTSESNSKTCASMQKGNLPFSRPGQQLTRVHRTCFATNEDTVNLETNSYNCPLHACTVLCRHCELPAPCSACCCPPYFQ